MTAVYRGDNELWLERPSGRFIVIDVKSVTWEVRVAFALPDTAVELLDPDDGKSAVLAEVRAALADVRMSKTARAAVTDALDALDPE